LLLEIVVHPLGGDNFNISLDASRAVVGEAKAEIARVQGTRESKQELFKVATSADGRRKKQFGRTTRSQMR
jgi:hypothetical protein